MQTLQQILYEEIKLESPSQKGRITKSGNSQQSTNAKRDDWRG